jgi:hypothetical protein
MGVLIHGRYSMLNPGAFVLEDRCEVGEAADSMEELLKWIQKR